MQTENVGLLLGAYYESITVPVTKLCYGFIAINKGAVNCWVNGIWLKPYPPGHPELSGESFSYVDPLGRYLNQDFTVTFDPGAGAYLQLIQNYKRC